jgi:hypothetical protein
LLDNGSTLSLFGNPDMVTNAGTKTTKQVADIPGFGTVWYDETAIANIFGLSDLKKKHRITFDSEKEDAFIVHMDNGEHEVQVQPQRIIYLRCVR